LPETQLPETPSSEAPATEPTTAAEPPATTAPPADDPFSSDLPPAQLPADEPPAAPSEPATTEPATTEPSMTEPSTTEPEPYTPGPLPGEEAPEGNVGVPDVESGVTPDAESACAQHKRDCLDAIETLRGRDIRQIVPAVIIEATQGTVAIEGRDFPCECAIGLRTTFQGRNWKPTTFAWQATGQCHKPLYFEDVQLERYGHTWNPVVQPFMSAAHFFGSVPLLPYKMGLNPPNECMYALGYYRPGNCAPYMIEPLPLSVRAGAFQALGITGFVFWFWPPVSGAAAAAQAL
jgi:hypothetical protein